MPSITLTARDLADLTNPVAPHASKDDTMPLLCSVFLRVRGGYVTAIATDRYRMALKRAKPTVNTEPPRNARPLATPAPGTSEDDPEPVPLAADFAAVVPVAVLTQVLRMFKPTRYADPVLTLTVEDEQRPAGAPPEWTPGRATLTVTATDGFAGLSGATLTYGVDAAAKYPPVDRLFLDAIAAADDPDQKAVPIALNPHMLALWAKGQRQHEPMVVTQGGSANKPVLIRIGDDFLGMQVPLRGGDPASAAGWLAMLDVPATAEKVA